MKKTLFLILLFNTFILAKMNVVVSILPEQTFINAIGGDKVSVSVMVLPGNSPHTYEPKPLQMKNLTKSILYFSIGVEFEKVWLPKFKSLNSNMQIIDVSDGIVKLQMSSLHHHESLTKKEEGKDPHIWTSPKNVKNIAKNILNALIKADTKNEVYYQKNYELFLRQIDDTDKKIKNILSTVPQKTKFMVFHPSWGYFAHEYGLEQLPVEIEGKSPKPKALIQLIQKAKEEKVSAIFTQPEFSDAVAKVMAKELHIEVIKVSPLAKNWSKNLIKIANAIAGNH